VLRDVPLSQRCQCQKKTRASEEGTKKRAWWRDLLEK
jgi:hypothetical protein